MLPQDGHGDIQAFRLTRQALSQFLPVLHTPLQWSAQTLFLAWVQHVRDLHLTQGVQTSVEGLQCLDSCLLLTHGDLPCDVHQYTSPRGRKRC